MVVYAKVLLLLFLLLALLLPISLACPWQWPTRRSSCSCSCSCCYRSNVLPWVQLVPSKGQKDAEVGEGKLGQGDEENRAKVREQELREVRAELFNTVSLPLQP